MLLYRYFGTHVLQTLQGASLKAAKPSEFNDPFECMFKSPAQPSAKEIRSFLVSRKNSPNFWRLMMGDRLTLLSESQLSKEFEKWLPIRVAEIKNNYEDFCEEMLISRTEWSDSFRVICFTGSDVETQDEILLWSHYANQHKGVRLGFEFPFPNDSLYSIRKVEYGAERVEVAFLGTIDKEAFSKQLYESFFVKSKAWKYENEHRLITKPAACARTKEANGNQIALMPFQRTWLRRVDFGVKTPEPEKLNILQVLKADYPHVQIRQAKYHPTEFELQFVEL